MCRWSASSVLAVLAFAVPAAADVRLEISGALQSGPPRVEVRVDLANLGDAPARGVSIEAELRGQRQVSRLEEELPPQVGGSAVFPFDVGTVPPGVYALALHVQYARSDAPGDTVSQRGYLLLALGAKPPPAVRLSVPDVRLDTSAAVRVRLESADLRPHRVRLRMLTPRGLQPLGPDPEVDVPAFGSPTAELRLLRGGAPRPSRQGVVVLAETLGGEVPNAAAGVAVVVVEAYRAWVPRLRWPLAGLALALIGGAAFVEIRHKRRSP